MELRYFDRDLVLTSRAAELHRTFDYFLSALCKVYRVVLDKSVRHFQQRHAASDSAIVPPVGAQSRHASSQPCVRHFHNYAVFAGGNFVCNLKLKRSKPAHMLAQLASVQPHPSLVVRRAEV